MSWLYRKTHYCVKEATSVPLTAPHEIDLGGPFSNSVSIGFFPSLTSSGIVRTTRKVSELEPRHLLVPLTVVVKEQSQSSRCSRVGQYETAQDCEILTDRQESDTA